MARGQEKGGPTGGSGTADKGGWQAPEPDSVLDSTTTPVGEKSWGVWYLRPEPRPYGNTTTLQGVANYSNPNSTTYNDYYTPTELSGAYPSLDDVWKDRFTQVAKSMSSRGTGSGLFSDLLQESSRQNSTGDRKVGPFELLQEIAIKQGLASETGEWLGGAGSGGGSGSYNGPVTTVTRVNDKDARLLVDSLASDILGRAATEDEFKRALSKLRATESANPSVSGGAGASQTNVSGLSAEGRNDAITRALLKEDGAKEFTLATKMMGLFDKALQGRPDAGQQ